jgi:hypothetical protein
MGRVARPPTDTKNEKPPIVLSGLDEHVDNALHLPLIDLFCYLTNFPQIAGDVSFHRLSLTVLNLSRLTPFPAKF